MCWFIEILKKGVLLKTKTKRNKYGKEFNLQEHGRKKSLSSHLGLIKRDSKTTYRSLLQNFHICSILLDMFIQNIELFANLDIRRYA